jgi:hypothetical protein
MASTKIIFKSDDRLEQYMLETQEYIVTLKNDLLKKILILQQSKKSKNTTVIDLSINSSNQIAGISI